ncbi:DUF2057 family protein [Marinobacter segnicrescens]|uniref:DUF2057 family protein n=1 Tax=Marinobacter segnicrescens TaxID=430453 RepID=UPI003A8FA4DB
MFARLKKLSPVGLRQLTVVLAIFAIAGCSSTGVSRVKTYDGGSSIGGVAVLKAPSTIKVQEVNGREVGNFLLEDLALDYELQPGQNIVVFTHKTIWAKSGVVRDGESAVHVVETGPQQVVIDARAGQEYRFDIPEVNNRREAERLAADFSVAVLAAGGGTVARSQPFEGYPQQPQMAGPAQVVTPSQPYSPQAGQPAPVYQGGQSGPGSRVETLEALKMLWERASGDEKREFLRWAFD